MSSREWHRVVGLLLVCMLGGSAGERSQLERDVAYAEYLKAAPAAHARFRATMDEDRLTRAEVFFESEEFVGRHSAGSSYTVRLNEFADMLPYELRARLAPVAAVAVAARSGGASLHLAESAAPAPAPSSSSSLRGALPTQVDWSPLCPSLASDVDLPSSLHAATASAIVVSGAGGEVHLCADPSWLAYCTRCEITDLPCLLTFLQSADAFCSVAQAGASLLRACWRAVLRACAPASVPCGGDTATLAASTRAQAIVRRLATSNGRESLQFPKLMALSGLPSRAGS